MPTGFLAYGCPVPGGSIATLVASSGNGSVPTESSAERGSGWPYKVIAGFDIHEYAFIEPGTTTICVGAATGDSAGIQQVIFYLNGNSVTVTTQTLNPDNNTYGFCVQPSTGVGGTDGDYTLYAKVQPVNGYERLLSTSITLNSNGTITRPLRYVDFANGSNANAGTAPGAGNAWKTISFATGAVSALPGGAAEIVCAAGTYLEDASGSGNTGNARLVKIRPASGTVTLSRTTRGTPTRDITLGCSKFEIVGLTLDLAKFPAVGGQSSGYSVVRQCICTDSNGILGGLYGYWQNEQIDNSCQNAIEECTISAPIYLSSGLERNNVSRVSWDAWMIGASNQINSNRGPSRWNIDLWQPNTFHQRCCSGTTITVTSSVFSAGSTKLQFGSGVLDSTNFTQGQVNVISGPAGAVAAKTILGTSDNGSGRTRLTLNNTTGMTTGTQIMIRGVVGTEAVTGSNPLNESWSNVTIVDGTHLDLSAASDYGAISGAYATTGSTWVSGGTVMLGYNFANLWNQSDPTNPNSIFLSYDATSVIPASTVVWVSTPAHADSDQYFAGGSNTVPYYDNIYWQKVKHTGVSLQHVLCQPGAGAGTGTISGGANSDGGVLNFTVAGGFGVDAWIMPTSGAYNGKAFRIASIVDANNIVFAANHRPAGSIVAGTTFRYSLAIRNHAQVECILVGGAANGQFQGGGSHWLADGCSFLGAAYNFRNDVVSNVSGSPEAQDGIVFRNSIFYKMGLQAGSWPTYGLTIDNCQFLVSDAVGTPPPGATNSVLASATFNTTIGTDYGRPTSGVSKTMTPPIPYDCSGRAITIGTNIGALAI